MVVEIYVIVYCHKINDNDIKTEQKTTKKTRRNHILCFAKSGLLNYIVLSYYFHYNNSSHMRPLHVHNGEYGNLSSIQFIHSEKQEEQKKMEKELQKSAQYSSEYNNKKKYSS